MLDKRSKKILYLFLFVLLVMLITEVTRPTPLNWSPSYTASDKIPFGSYVLFEELPGLFDEMSVAQIKEDPYIFLSKKKEETNACYLFINDYLDFDKRQIEELLNFANQGNTVFLAANYFGNAIEDTLGFYVDLIYSKSVPTLKSELNPAFYSPSLDADTAVFFSKGVRHMVFKKLDTLNTRALGYYRTQDKPQDNLNFVEITHGDGRIIINTLPEAFSNYYMLQPQQTYASNVLSFIDNKKVYWDSYLKSGKRIISSPMRYVFNQKSLRWAYYILITGLILFVVFRAKREQRIIEVVNPLENTSVEFTRTIGQMYFQHRDYGNIIAKKINYFLEVVRSKFYLDTTELTVEFSEKLALKSGNSLDKTNKLIKTINHQKSKAFHSEADLLELNKSIEEFRI